MNTTPAAPTLDWSRRDFIKAAAGTSIAAAVLPSFASGWTNGGADTVRVGVIGCGGRGTGAAFNALEAHPSTRIVALADLFPDRLDGARNYLTNSEDFADRGDPLRQPIAHSQSVAERVALLDYAPGERLSEGDLAEDEELSRFIL